MKYPLAIALCACWCATTLASLQVDTKVQIDRSLPGDAGQFGVINPGTNPDGYGFAYFVTFCVEVAQPIRDGGIYYVTGMAEENTSGYSLGEQAAYLYAEYRTGGFGLLFDPTSADHANGLQYGIWLGMGYDHDEIADVMGTSRADRFRSLWNDNKGVAGESGWLADFDSWSGIGNVRVMQLGDTPGRIGKRQDQLTMIPEASTVAVWSIMGLMGLASVGRLKRLAGVGTS